MKASRTLMIALLLVAAGCTTVNYESPELMKRTSRHHVVAVLPFEIVLTGTPPEGLTAQQIAAIEEAESLAFQQAYYARLLNQSSARRKHPIRIRIQPIEETNRLLAGAGITVRDSWTRSAKGLAQVLKVDAVISTSVHKTRYLSDGESFGIDLGLSVVNEVTEGVLAPLLPWGLSKTHDIWAASELIDCLDGAVLWQAEIESATDWQQPANHVISGFTRKLAKDFPYRG